MRWYKHETSDRNKIEAKLIRSKFGAEGYGIYQALLEVIGEYVDKENWGDWGHADPMHTIDTLADECSTTTPKLKEFLKFCDEKKIFEKNDNRLYSPLILRRLDDYAERIQRDYEHSKNKLRTRSDIEEKRREDNKTEGGLGGELKKFKSEFIHNHSA